MNPTKSRSLAWTARRRVVRSDSSERTHELGRQLAGALTVPSVVLLCGSLGTGKTTLARGIAEGLGLADPDCVHSPSFTLVNVYRGRCPIYHVDLYRLGGERDLQSVGLEDFLGKDGVTIVEWGERILDRGDATLVVDIEDAGGESRILRVLEHAGTPPKGKKNRRMRPAGIRHVRNNKSSRQKS
jgi:tRNA threonylcarbamoyladenosine biosynthesis protein TsaE